MRPPNHDFSFQIFQVTKLCFQISTKKWSAGDISPFHRAAQEKLDPDVFKAIQFAERNDLPFAGEESLNRLAGQ
jgi:hypothetical protein